MMDEFDKFAFSHPDYAQYKNCSQYLGRTSAGTDDWEDICFITEDLKSAISYTIYRSKENTLEIAIYAMNAKAASRLIKETLDKVIKMYNPKALTSFCHSSNKKSIRINTKRLGEPWGIEPQGAWNIVEGRWEDKIYFKKILR
jgi:hypothetical protein